MANLGSHRSILDSASSGALGTAGSRGQGGTHHPDPEPRTFWNGEPCEARKVRVVVGNSGRFSAPWFSDYIGQEREAVEVTYGGQTFYLDNEDGSGWGKVTVGHGSPSYGHGSLDVERVLDDR
jgi:hypothetical protein